MEKKSISHSAFLSLRALIALLLCAPASFVALGTVPDFLRPEARADVSQRILTFAERVAYQRAIEEVYWRHRMWPKENPEPKPSLDAMISQTQIERKVADYLRKSHLVTDQRGSPITASELQAEMERMAKHTRQPDVLSQIFAALDNDPLVVAECLARPILAERLTAQPGDAVPELPRAKSRDPVERPLSSSTEFLESTRNDILSSDGAYKLPEISDPLDCVDNSWTATTIVNAPDARELHTAIWTGSEMIVWGGFNFNGRLNTGGRYEPSTDSWISTSLNNAPSPRDYHSAVWTGSEMIVWGGEPILNTGGRYNPVTDSWAATSTTNAPTARAQHTAVWTGTEMIVWGGYSCCTWFNTGGRYDPNTNNWTATSTINAPEARWAHTVEWTGSKMIVWGGTNQTNYLNTGGRYDPASETWTPTGLVNVPLGRVAHTAVWSGSEMIVWGGVDEFSNFTNTGGRYNPAVDIWTATSTANAPSPRASHTPVWTESQMIVWSGYYYPPGINLDTGGRYEPAIDSWTPTSTANVPLARENHTAVWTGSEMISWGGFNVQYLQYLNTGGRYCAQSAATPTPTPTATPTATPTPTASPMPRPPPVPRPRPSPAPRP